MPNPVGETAYLYRDFRDAPIAWWEPLAMQPEVESWLTPAARCQIVTCASQA